MQVKKYRQHLKRTNYIAYATSFKNSEEGKPFPAVRETGQMHLIEPAFSLFIFINIEKHIRRNYFLKMKINQEGIFGLKKDMSRIGYVGE